jgi:hypothetical protein
MPTTGSRADGQYGWGGTWEIGDDVYKLYKIVEEGFIQFSQTTLSPGSTPHHLIVHCGARLSLMTSIPKISYPVRGHSSRDRYPYLRLGADAESRPPFSRPQSVSTSIVAEISTRNWQVHRLGISFLAGTEACPTRKGGAGVSARSACHQCLRFNLY